MGQHRPGWGVAGGDRLVLAEASWWDAARASSSLPTPTPTPTSPCWCSEGESKKGFYLLSPQDPHTLVPDIPTPPPRQSTFPTDPGAWPQAGWPRTPQNPASSSPRTSGCCSAGCGLLLEQTYPRRVRDLLEGLPGWARQGWDV